MSVPGIVRRPDGLLRFAPNLGWVDVPLGARLAERIGLPVTIGNDADLGAVAEHWRGVAVGYDNVVLMSGEIGIGGGILIDGRSLGGRGGYAGEIGHLRLNPAGRACRCGSWGCLETEIGIEALLRAANRPLSGGLTAYRTVLREAAGGRDQALAAAAHVAGWLGRGMGLLVNTFNPDIVVLAGALRELFAICGKQVAAEFSASSLVASREEVRLTAAALDPDGQLIGAAELAFGPLLDDPLGTLARIA
jgi:predicted NBD/HSP70 family sugar kinase